MKYRLLLFASVLVSCGGTTHSNVAGALGGDCYPNATCNFGLACASGTCTAPMDATVEDSATVQGGRRRDDRGR